MSRLTALALASLLGAALPACAKAHPGPPEPVAVHFGEDECAHCKMLVSDDRQAAELVTSRGVATLYDDVGCLLTQVAGSHPDPQSVFVRAFDGGAWLRGSDALLVRSGAIASPMGYGFAAFASRDAAETEARRHTDASIVPFATLLRDGIVPRPPGAAMSAAMTGAIHASQGEIQP